MSKNLCFYRNNKTEWCRYWHMRTLSDCTCSGFVLECLSCGVMTE